MKLFYSFIILIASCLSVHGQNMAASSLPSAQIHKLSDRRNEEQLSTIKGLVTTSDNQPASFVNIILKETGRGTTTDDKGIYLLKNIKPGNYTLVTSFIGLETQEQPVSVLAGETIILNITLHETAQQLAEIIISDTRSLNERTASIGKAFIKPMDLPQSVMVIDKTIFERQQTLRLSDVLMNTNGIYVMGTSAGTQEEIAGRGFSYGSSNTFKNGVRFNNGIMPEASSLERVEVLKGSNAILFGNVAAGGVLNLVTKKPKFDKGGEFSFRAGSYDFYKPSLDIYGAIGSNNSIAYRLNTSYENAGSFRDEVNAERIYFNPSFLIRAGTKTEIIIEGDYLKDNRTLDYGTGAIDYKIINIDRNRFLGAPWSYNKAHQKSVTATVTHYLSSNFQLKALVSYQGYESDLFGTTRPNSGNLVQADGKWLRGLQRSGTNQDYYLAQLDAIATIKTGSVEHDVMLGSDRDIYYNTSLSYSYKNPLANSKINGGNVYDSINVFDLNQYETRNDIPQLAKNTRTENPIHRTGIYIQDLVHITSQLKVLAGVRYSVISSESNVYNFASDKTTPNVYKDDAFTPRFGIVYQPLKIMSIFASYANSFNLNTARDTTDNVLPPSFIDQYEVGIKNELLNGMLSWNVTLYKIINSNLAQPYIPANAKFPSAQQLAGEVTSKGIEVDIMSKPLRGFSLIAGYSYNDTRYTKSQQFIVGSKLRYNPAHTANASIYYSFDQKSFLNGFNIGLIGFYMGERVAGRSTQLNVQNDTRKLMPVAPYFQLDASAGYTVDKISLRLKVSNLLNELSYHVHDDNSVNPIAPRMFAATLAYQL